MKTILLSAYACEPYKGSEPGVGWHWAMELSQRDCFVHVITRLNNQMVINHYFQSKPKPKNLTFHYVDVPKWISWWKKGGFGIHFYYFLWQVLAILYIKSTNINFDVIHHLTFGGLRLPSFMGCLNGLFIYGPVGGGERAPFHLRSSYTFKGKILDFCRDLANYTSRFDPFMHLTYSSADKIYLKSPDSKWVIPKKYHSKISVSLEIGCDIKYLNCSRKPDNFYRVLFVGRFIYWKGIYIVLDTIKKLKLHKDIKFTFVGSGPDASNLKNYIRFNCLDNVEVINWVDQHKLKEIYSAHDLFFFPSLHDSSGNVILEAMTYSLPILALDLGGPGYILRDTCNTLIDPTLSYGHVINQCANAIILAKSNATLRNDLGLLYSKKLRKLTWSNAVDRIYSCL